MTAMQSQRRKHSTRLLRPKAIYERLGLGRTTVNENYFFHEGSDPYVPGTKIKRLRLVRLGLRAIAAPEDEVDDLVEALRQHRDGKSNA